MRKKILILLLLVTAAGCNRTRYSYFEKKLECSKFITDKKLREDMFGEDFNLALAIPVKSSPIVFYSTSLDTCVAVTTATMSGQITVTSPDGSKRVTNSVGSAATYDLLTGMVLDSSGFTTEDKNDFLHYQERMMKRYEAAE